MPVRETFWNIPHWIEIGSYLLGLAAVLVFLFGVWRRVKRWRLGKPEKRTDHLGERIKSLFVQAIGQVRTAQEAYPGIMHLTIFWGMAALFLGTVVATVDWDVTHLFFGFQFLKGGLYILYELILDVLGIFLLVGLGMAAFRRYVSKPARLQNNPIRGLAWDDMYAIGMLALIAVSGYLVEGLRIAVIQPAWAPWSPVGNALAGMFLSSGQAFNSSFHISLWVLHGLIAFIFIASIPFTKLFHIVSAPINIFFRSLEPAGALAPARYRSGPGVKEWRDFTWKQILDFEACTRCGRCQDTCPSFASGMNFSPRDFLIKVGNHIWTQQNGDGLHGDTVSADEVWACTTCRACIQVCPVFVDHISSLVDMRRYLVDQGAMDGMLQESLSNLGRYGNSFGQSERMRARWSQTVQPKIKDARKSPVEYLWFVGDYASYHANLTPITRRTAEVFQHVDLDFGILYDAERNAGNDVRRAGEEGLFELLMEKNAMALARCDYQAIVTTDPHSYNSLKNEYPFNGDGKPEILHYSELLAELIESGRLKFSRKLEYTVTFQDPCYLGRYNGIYSAPRRVVAATGCKLVEMPRHGDRSLCCGAGGGRIWMEEGLVGERPSEARIREAVALDGVEALVVACPKDVSMYQDAVKTTGYEDRLKVKDLIDLVYEAL